MKRLPLSVVTIARNEAMNIVGCVANTNGRVDEHLVLDMESEDDTAELARRKGARVLPVARIPNFDAARIPGIEAARNEWILVLDADERVTNDLWNQLEAVVSSDALDLAMIPIANFAFSGIALHESGWPEWHARMFRKSSVDQSGWSGKLHGEIPFRKGIRKANITGHFPECAVLHLTNPTVEFFVNKINVYTSREAAERQPLSFDSRIKIACWLWRPWGRFWMHYVRRGGWKDGWRGFMLSGLFFVYEFLILAKQWECHLHCGHAPSLVSARQKMLDSLPPGILEGLSSDREPDREST